LIYSSLRSVSTYQLNILLYLHFMAINGWSCRDLICLRNENTHLEVGFPLRCFQWLSVPYLATQRLPLAW